MPRTITLTFGDGSQHVYDNVPDEVTPDAVTARAGQDFPGKPITNIDGGRKTYDGIGSALDTMQLTPDQRAMADFSFAATMPAQRAAVTPLPPPDRLGENVAGLNKAIYRTAGAVPDALSGILRSIGGAARQPIVQDTPYGMGAGLGGPILKLLESTGLAGAFRDAPEPVGGSASIQRGAEAAGVRTVEPVDRQGRFTSRILEETLSALLPAGMLTKSAQAAKAAGRMPAKTDILYPYAATPVRESVNQAALGASAGAGAAAATEAFGNTPAADIIGAIVGSFGGSNAAKVGGLAARTTKDIIKPQRVAREAVSDRLVEAMTDKKVDPDTGRVTSAGDVAFGANLPDSRALEADVPGLKLPTGEATLDPGLQSLEYQRRTGPHAGSFRKQEQSNRQAVNTALDEAAPVAKDDAAARAALERRRVEATAPSSRVAQAVDAREADVEAARRAAEPGMSVPEAGREIRSTAQRGKETMESLRDAEALPILKEAEGMGAVVDTAPVAKVIDDMLAVDKRDSVRAALEGVKSKLMKVGSKDELDTSVSGLYETRKVIRDAIEGKGERPTDRYAKKELMAVREALDAEINKATGGKFGEYLKKYSDDSRLVDEFKRGATDDVIAKDRTGTEKLSDRESAARFWDSPDSIEEFQRNLGGNKGAVKALRAYALDDALTSAANVDGVVDPKRLEAWIKKNKAQLDAFPEIREDLGSLASAQKSLARAAKRKEMVARGLHDPKRSTIAKYLDREEATESIDAILRSKNPRREMTQLVNTLKRDPDALEGAKRALWDRMMKDIVNKTTDSGDNPVVSNAAFKKFMAESGDVARILYADAPEHLKRLERISEAVSATQRTTNIKAPGTSGTSQTGTGITLAGMISRGYALQRGVVGLPYVIAESSIRGAKSVYMKVKQREFDRLLDQALIDPEVAKTLVMEWNESNQRVIQRRLKLHLGHEIEVGAAEAAKPEEDKPKGS